MYSKYTLSVFGFKGWGALLCVFGLATSGIGQLRIATYNISNYDGTRVNELKTVFYGVYQTRQLAPDAIVCQEFLTASALSTFVSLLNTATGSPGDWVSAPFVDGVDTDSVFCYRTSKIQFLGQTIVSTGSSSTSNQPRNIMRYDFRCIGYTGEGATLSYYSTHMKAGTTATDMSRRLIEAQKIRTDAQNLPSDRQFALGGDFNIQTSTEAAYVHLVESSTNDQGRLFDPIASPGSWVNNGAFRYIHTQDPVGGGGMDDRYDQILLCDSLVDGSGFDYIGAPTSTFSTTTWNDPNHSYRCWGNDGSSFNSALTTTGNQMVGATIAQALITAADTSGHLPVYLDLKVPPKMAVSTETLSFGKVLQGTKPIRLTFSVMNSGNTSLWNEAGIADLEYSVAGSGWGFLVPNGNYLEPSSPGFITHEVWLDTRRSGWKVGTITISSNDPDVPIRNITLTGYVIGTSGR